ncbi:hypothetical protein, partial [Streptomyces lonarensis]
MTMDHLTPSYQIHRPDRPETARQGVVVPTPAASDSIVYVPGPGGLVGVPRSSLPPEFFDYTPTAVDPAPAPRQGIDPRAQVLVAGGVGIGAAGWGLGQLVTAVAGIGAAGLLAIALAILALRMPRPGT